jgi:hypothetical protein
MKKICFLTMMGLMSWILMLTPSMAQKSGKNAQAGSSPAYACEEDVIEIMFSWESRVRMRNETLVDLATNALQGTDQILNELAWHQWIRLTDVSETLVDSWETNGELNTGEDLYNLNNVYRLRIPKGHDIWEISARLEALQGVHLARPVPKPVVPPSLPPPPGSYQSQQGYLNPASYNPSGVDAIYAWTQTGGTGTGITICDLEYSWNYNHADITKAIGSQINPNPITDPFNNTNHGTAVIGELVANNNGWGTTGICYGASLKTCGTNYAAGGGWNVPGAMTYAIASLSAGDIILLEQQWEYTSGLQNYIPIEWWLNYSNSAQTYNAVYAAIVTAVANGIHVVEAGGNGNVNTGSLTWYGDSGAIIVGAGGATTTNDRQRLSFSSYGPRFNLQGWGENIVTTGGSYYGPDLYSAEGPNYYYTNTFNGTSGASPIVAASIACTEGYYLANISSVPPTPAFMRSHLATYGTAQVYGPSGNIGPRPNIQAAIQNFPPPQLNYDWGDTPDPPYPTLTTNNGAFHLMDGVTYLGNSVDAENNGQPNVNATGDDNDGNNDDDGVIFTSQLIPGQNANVQVIASAAGVLNAWIDFNQMNNWSDAGEFIFQNIPLNQGVNNLSFFVPPNALTGYTYARFRYNTYGGILFYGNGQNGEVEDYQVFIGGGGQDELDWGDAPDGPYPTLNSSNGARHQIVTGVMLGISIDSEPNGQPDPQCLGDDNDLMYPPPNDDEDGVVCQGTFIPGQPANINVTVSVQGYLNAWFDFNNNGSWLDPGEHIFPDILIPAGLNPLVILIPPAALPGQTYARFRFSTVQGLSFTGFAPDGEVEDYLVTIGLQPEEFDWGDAPDGPYPTLGASNGAHHRIVPGFMLGSSIDPEPDGQPEPMALGDDNDIFYPPVNDDEDGVIFTSSLIPGQSATVNITASAMGILNAWIDFNLNGSWADSGEHIFLDMMLNPGINSLSFPVPPSATVSQTFARFRFSNMMGLTYTGMAPDGEVEDYTVNIDPQPEEFDWGDAPDFPYPTKAANNGARHRIMPGFMLGSSIDPEPDGQPEPMALGDDNDIFYPPVNDDEDGVVFTSPLISAQIATVNITASVNGLLNAWIDFNINGFWGDPGEQIFFDIILNPGLNTLSFPVPATATAGISFARFRFSSMPGLTFTGMAPDGEVEDYAVNIEPQSEEFDWGDAPDGPYPTLGVNNGARHLLDGVTFLGQMVDAEADGQPHPNALGDDNNNAMDEDGVQFNWPLLKGSPVMITITASTSGLLNGWIDFNRDGTWAQPNEQVFVDFFISSGTHQLNFIVPPTAQAGISFARFRFSNQPGLSYTGLAFNGEVEDYEVMIVGNPELKWQQLPDAGRPGLHAHDYINSAGNNEWITLADDWLCNGGRVTDIHWWGNYELNAAQQEIKGAGISHFHLSIHAHNPGGNCLPVEPEVWGIDVPFNSITEQFTGSLNNELSPIYLYEFTLPVPFQQVPGTRYWLDITAVSVNPNQNPHWRWQEAIRGNLPILCSAADKISPVPGSWSTIFWPATGLFNDMAFAITNVPDKALNLKFFLEGLYAGAGTMNKAQDASGNHFASDTADVVTIELHDATSYSIIVHSMNNVAVNTNGQATIGTVPYTMTGSYYITIKHRNSIETVSANPVSFAGNSISYDFSTAASQAYGSNQKGIGGTYVIYGGDVNQDGVIDTADMTPIDNDSANYASGYLDTDVNGDGVIDTADMTIVDNNAAAYVGVVTP